MSMSCYRNRISVVFFGFCLVSLISFTNVKASDWPYFRGPERSGVTAADMPDDWEGTELEVAWEASVGWGFSAIAVSDGKAFIMGNQDDNDVLHCFDAGSGELIWKQSYPENRWPRNTQGGPYAAPVVHNGRVYTFSRTGKIFARDVEDGSVIWDVDTAEKFGINNTSWGLSGSALIVDDKVVFNAGSYGIAFNKVSGEKVWRNGTGPGGYATPVKFDRGGKTMLAMFVRRELAIVDPDDGNVLATYDWRTNHDVNASDPIVAGDNIFISTGYGKGGALLEFEEDGLSEVWNTGQLRTQMNGSVLWEGHLYGFDDSRHLRCLDFETGEVKWEQGGLGRGTLIVAGGNLVVLSENGLLVIAEATPEGYNKLAEKKVLSGRCWTMPVMAGGRIYARNAAGDVVCVEIK